MNIANINQKTFCVSPWHNLRIHSDGSLNFCDHASLKNLVPDENLIASSVEKFYNFGQTMQLVRKQLLEGSSNIRCSKCLKNENESNNSYRLRYNLRLGIFPGEHFQQSLEESSIQKKLQLDNIKPRFYHISFSNICNLACLMCKDENSTKLALDWKKAGIITSDNVKKEWATGKVWDSFLEHLKHNDEIFCIHIMGGEPLHHPQFENLLNFLIDNNKTDIYFTFVTNGTVYNNKIIQLLQRFKGVQIEISLENFGKSNDYIRWPGKTDSIKENIQKWLSHRNENFDVVLRTVPQVLSLFEYTDVLDFCLENNVALDANQIKEPFYFHPCILSSDLKEKCKSKLLYYANLTESHSINDINLRNNKKVLECVSNNAKTIINMLEVDIDQKQLLTTRKELIQYLKKMDTVRNIDVRNYVPDIASWLVELGYE